MQTAAAETRTQSMDRRRHRRMKVALLGRYMLADRREYACQTADMSPGGASLVAPVKGAVGERVVLYLEHIGRVEGEITRHTPQGFTVSIAATVRKRDKIASQLTWLANRGVLGLPEDRRHERVVLRNPFMSVKSESGQVINVRVIDVSLSGAGIATVTPLPIGTPALLGRTPCKVVRHFADGMAVEFLRPISPDRFNENLEL